MFIAEIGINHNGDLKLAKKMILEAKKAGADVVKFQKRTPDICVPENKKSEIRLTPWGEMKYIDYKKKIEFGRKEYDSIDKYCKRIGIPWTASVWDIESLSFIMQYDIPFIKVPSACITDMDLLKAIRATKKPVVISTGMSSMGEIAEAVEILKDRELSILHCKSSYPTPPEEINLSAIQTLHRLFPKHVIGYSGHEEGTYPSLCAALMGARIIERHVTLDKEMWGTDQKASLNFEELKDLIEGLKDLPRWFGKGYIGIAESELPIKEKLRRH
jgi:N-acetylneuraminate synthase